MTRRALVIGVLLFLIQAFGAMAAQMASTVAAEYGAWSAWQQGVLVPGKNLEVECELRAVSEDTFAWKYTRYVYYNTIDEAWFAAAYEQTGAHCREGSGYWEESTLDAPLAVSGMDGEDAVYEGGWFNEAIDAKTSTTQQVMYRSRSVRRVTCEVTAAQMLVFEGGTRTLEVNFFDEGGVTFISSDDSIATIDQTGLIRAEKVGVVQVTARSSKGREAVVEVLVCQKTAHVPDGLYTFRLLGTAKALSEGKRISSQSDNVMVSEFTGERKQRFIVEGMGSKTFSMRPLSHRENYIDIARNKKNEIAVGSNVQTHARRDRAAQYWRAVYVPDGSYILYPKANADTVLGAEPTGARSNVRLEALSPVLEELDRWVLVKADTSIDPESPFARPVARDGASYVEKEFSGAQDVKRDGMSFASNGRRVFVLSTARGTVVEVGDDCAHDYAKAPNVAGYLIDPCGASGESLGKYVVIDHGGGVTCVYAHLSSVFVAPGESVRQGSLIGRSGATGSTQNVGLYLEMHLGGKAVNPREYIKLPDVGEPIGK